jgi:hypothetical protein
MHPIQQAVRARLATALALAALLATTAHAQSGGPSGHPWITTPLRLTAPTTYFTNLDDGARIETPYLVRFGLSGFGIAPIVKGVPRTGHHHLLVNRDLPLDFQAPLPFNDQYIHFGKGQMETVLSFPPGTYQLRLLLADHKHIPHFIYSKPIQVTVTAKRDDVDPKSLIQPGVSILEPAPGAVVQNPFNIVFHASGLNVSHVDLKEKDTGHFRLAFTRDGKTERIDFPGGHTEAWLQPPAGDYRVQLEFVSNTEPGRVMASSAPMELKVAR